MSGSVRYRVEHVTRYVHTERASTSQHVACLQPRWLPRQQVQSHALFVEPQPAEISTRMDYFGNELSYFAILTPYLELRVASRTVVDVFPTASVDPDNSPTWEHVRDLHIVGGPQVDVEQFRCASPSVETAPELEAFASSAFTPGTSLLTAAIELMHKIHRECRFDPGTTSITTPVTRVLAERQGVCQDFAHLQIACMRSLGLPARYVSGYLMTDPPPGQPRLVGADASHAWVSVWCPTHGWVDLDPTNDVLPSQRHVTIAWGRDYGDVSPLRGVVLGGDQQRLHVGVSVVPEPIANNQTLN